MEGKDAEVSRHDLAKELPPRELLEKWVDEEHLRDFINTRSPLYKQMNLASRNLTKGEAIDLMLREPNLIRRPIVVSGKRAAFGFDPETYDGILGKK